MKAAEWVRNRGPAIRALLREQGRSLLTILLLLATASLLMALRSGSQDPQRVVGGTLILAAFAVGPLLVSGVVSDDLRTGAILLWLQKPVSPLGFYLRRLGLALGVATATVLALLLAGVLALAAAGDAGPLVLIRLAPVVASCTVLGGLVTFAFSGLGLRRDGTLTLLYLLLAVPGGLMLALADDPGGLPVRIAAWIALFPLNELQLLHRWIVDGGLEPRGTALLRVTVFGLTWLGVGAAATWHTTRRPFGGSGS